MDPVTVLGVALFLVGVVGLLVMVPAARRSGLAKSLVVWLHLIYPVWLIIGVAILFVPAFQALVRSLLRL